MSKVMTAQRLHDGIVVFWRDGEWTESVLDATPLDEAAVEMAMAEGRADQAENLVIDVGLIDVQLQADKPVPTRRRERLRALGPSVRADLVRAQDMEI
ncbi:MAG: DUF2849 domain-containing protein [Myxococcota bacterium]